MTLTIISSRAFLFHSALLLYKFASLIRFALLYIQSACLSVFYTSESLHSRMGKLEACMLHIIMIWQIDKCVINHMKRLPHP